MNNVVKFIAKYAEEAALLSRALRALGTEFLGSQEKERVESAIKRYEEASKRIEDALPQLATETTVKVSKADIKKAVEELLPSVIAEVVKQQANEAQTSSEQPQE